MSIYLFCSYFFPLKCFSHMYRCPCVSGFYILRTLFVINMYFVKTSSPFWDQNQDLRVECHFWDRNTMVCVFTHPVQFDTLTVRADFVMPLLILFQATRQFLEEINKWTSQHGVSPLSRELAVKFLMARKFDVLRAIELFHSYRVRRVNLLQLNFLKK